MEKDNLYQQIESILFDEDNLNTLKEAISSLNKGTLTSKRLKEQIIEFRLNAVQEIVRLFRFYHRQLTEAVSLEKYTNNPVTPQLEQELSEKNEFLHEVGSRIHNIYTQLRQKIGLKS